MATTNPLNWNVPIVNPDRTPTHEFMQKWVLQARINGAIPTLSTAPEVSAVLDVLGSARGDILRRGLSTWGVLPSPSDPTKFLSGALDPAWDFVRDSDLALTNITANDVSIVAHGFAPKAPNDATKYLDGTGNYTVPPSGGGGFMDPFMGAPPIDPNTSSANAGGGAFSGRPIIPIDAVVVTGVQVWITNTGGARNIAPGIYQASGTHLGGGARIATGPTVAMAVGLNVLPFAAPVTLTPGQLYWLGWGADGGTFYNTAPVPWTQPAEFFALSGGNLPLPNPAAASGSGSSPLQSSWGY